MTAAQSGQPMEASKYFKAMLLVEEGSSEFIGSELSALHNIKDLQLTGLVRGDLGSAPRAGRNRNWGKNTKKESGVPASHAESSEVAVGQHVTQQGRSKGQSPHRDGGAGPRK